MIFNIDPICRTPYTIFDGVADSTDNYDNSYTKYKNTTDFKQQFIDKTKEDIYDFIICDHNDDVDSQRIVRQYEGYIQIAGNITTFGYFDSDGEMVPFGIYIPRKINLTGKNKLLLNVSVIYEYFATDTGVLPYSPTLNAYLFKDANKQMSTNYDLSITIPGYYNETPDAYHKILDESAIVQPSELSFNVANLEGEYYLGFSINGGVNDELLYYYLQIGEILAI